MIARIRPVLLSLMAFVACAEVPSSELIRMAGQTPPEKVGWAMLSLTASGDYKWIMRTSFYFRDSENKMQGEVVGFGPQLLSDTPRIPPDPPLGYEVEANDPLGTIKLLELPAGDYEVYRFRGSAHVNTTGARSLTYTIGSAENFILRFTVVPGRVTYIGNMNLAFSPDRTARFELNDRRARDTALFKAQFAGFSDKPIRVALARR